MHISLSLLQRFLVENIITRKDEYSCVLSTVWRESCSVLQDLPTEAKLIETIFDTTHAVDLY